MLWLQEHKKGLIEMQGKEKSRFQLTKVDVALAIKCQSTCAQCMTKKFSFTMTNPVVNLLQHLTVKRKFTQGDIYHYISANDVFH